MFLQKRFWTGSLCILVALALLCIGYVFQVRSGGRELVVRWKLGVWRLGRDDSQEASYRIIHLQNREIREKPLDAAFAVGPIELRARRWVRF